MNLAAIDAVFAGPWGPVVIFLLRIVDVSLATLRMLLVMRGEKRPVFLIALVESLVWICAVGSAIKNLSSGWHLIGYSAGFASGNIVGLWIEEKLAYGLVTLRVITRRQGPKLARFLRQSGYGVTEFKGRGKEGAVSVLLVVALRREAVRLLSRIHKKDAKAFVTIEEPKAISRGWLFSGRRK